MHAGDDSTPAARLKLLQNEYLQPGRGQQRERVTASTTPSAPIRLSVYDHIAATVDEAIQHTRAAAPDVATRPAGVDRLYDWWMKETAHLDEGIQRARDTLIYRQGLEHAIVMGDDSVIRPHPCPACATWGLFWAQEEQAVICTNRRCTDEDGLTTRWTIAQIADAHVNRKTHTARRAT